MHNDDDFFQYFTLDFQGADTAYHGSTILTQAVFVNDAIRAVQELYRQQALPGVRALPRVMVVAHSLGGIVARTAVLLNNHPTAPAADAADAADAETDAEFAAASGPERPCAVSDIVMLSSPNHRAPYAPDPSLEALFNAVNRAWQASLLTQSKACVSAAYRHAQLDRIAANSSSGGNSANGSSSESSTVAADWQCSHCASRVRLVSLSGGSLDALVHAHITRVDGLAPPPRNLTHERSPAAATASASYLAPILNLLNPMHWVATAVGKGLSRLAGSGGGNSNNSSSNDSSIDSSGNSSSSSGAPADTATGGGDQVCTAGDACAPADAARANCQHHITRNNSRTRNDFGFFNRPHCKSS